MVQKSLLEVLFQCWLVENSLPFPAISTGLLSLLTWLKGMNMCSATKSDKKNIIVANNKHTLFYRGNFGIPPACTSLPDSMQLKPDFSSSHLIFVCYIICQVPCLIHPLSVESFDQQQQLNILIFWCTKSTQRCWALLQAVAAIPASVLTPFGSESIVH